MGCLRLPGGFSSHPNHPAPPPDLLSPLGCIGKRPALTRRDFPLLCSPPTLRWALSSLGEFSGQILLESKD